MKHSMDGDFLREIVQYFRNRSTLDSSSGHFPSYDVALPRSEDYFDLAASFARLQHEAVGLSFSI